jgi:hypothetical protein
MTDIIQSIRTVTATRFLPLDGGEIRGFLADGITTSLSIGSAAEKIANQIGNRATLARVVACALDLLRERAAENDQLAAELDRAEIELDRRDAAAVS